MIITRFADHVAADETRLNTADITELQNQMNCNLFDAEDNGETWFNEETEHAHVSTINEMEFFSRYFLY
jgi:hypothetical protein